MKYQNHNLFKFSKKTAFQFVFFLFAFVIFYALFLIPEVKAFSATGGTVTYTDSNGLNPRTSPAYDGGYVVHTFTSSGTFSVTEGGYVDYLVVAGGGGGGRMCGGGGAGGLLHANSVITQGDISVVVGSGGAAGTINGVAGSNGGNSSFGEIEAIGGGGGNYGSGLSGGSGGGSWYIGSGGGSGTSGQGNKGGNGTGSSGDWGSGAGGGGAGVAGANCTGTASTAGGNGLAYSISGTSTYYAGGGAGGSSDGRWPSSASGGLGGGGSSSYSVGSNGTVNTGGGGGSCYSGSAGAGGSGIVIVKYRNLQSKTVTNPTSEDIESDIAAGYLYVSGTNAEATSATTNANYTIQSGSFEYVIPSGTIITPTEEGTMNITNLTISDISETVNQENFNSKGAIKVGIENQGLTFSQPITITLDVGSDYNGKTLKVYYRIDNEEEWAYENTCDITDGKCTFTTDHATEYTANYEVSNSNTPTDINLGLDSTISLTCTDSITMGTITGTGQSSLATNEALCTISTNNSTGYALYWQASTAYLENGTGDQITAYTPITPDTPENWSISATESEWGGKLKSGSTTYNSSTWGDEDTYSGGNWINISTSPYQIITRTTETTQEGDNETLLFGAEIGSNKFQPTGTYDVDVTVTATTL